MKSMLKYILPLLCFVALMNSSEATANGGDICKAMPEVMVTTSNTCISTDDAECTPIRSTSSVNSGQRVQKNSRHNIRASDAVALSLRLAVL